MCSVSAIPGCCRGLKALTKNACAYWFYNGGLCLCPFVAAFCMGIFIIQLIIPVAMAPLDINFSQIEDVYENVLPMRVGANMYSRNGNTGKFFRDFLGNTTEFNLTSISFDRYETNISKILYDYGSEMQAYSNTSQNENDFFYGSYMLFNKLDGSKVSGVPP